jgi:hypothetical protein
MYPLNSIIVFSDHCNFKNVTLSTRSARVIYCYQVSAVVDEIMAQAPVNYLTDLEVSDIS